MNHVCYSSWNSKSLAGFHNGCSSFKKDIRGRTSCDKVNDATERTSEKNGISYKNQCGNHRVIAKKQILWIWHLSFVLACELSMNGVSFLLVLKTFSGSVPKQFWQIFHWCQFSWGCALRIYLWISNGCKTSGVHSMWMKWERKMPSKWFSCILSFFFFFLS